MDPSKNTATCTCNHTEIMFYTPQELADMWRVSRSTIYHLTRRYDEEGRLPAIKIGGTVRIPVAEAEAYIERNKRAIPPPLPPMRRKKTQKTYYHKKEPYVYKPGDKVV